MRVIRRFLVLMAGVTGLLAAFAGAAHAVHVAGNHCEPPQHR